MEIMMMLDTEELNEVSNLFKKKKDGLDLTNFVDVLMDKLHGRLSDEDVELVRELCELFYQVDVNSDGTMEWSEFSAFCIEAGMAATRKEKVVMDVVYQERAGMKFF